MSWTSLAGPIEHEIDPIKNSRFIAVAEPVSDEDAAWRVLEQARERWPDANHHCWAWRLTAPPRERCSDDGEPGGSAGRPILMALQGRDVSSVMLVVVRYFGGTKLGVGGLVRAYGQAAGELLQRAELVTREASCQLWLSHDYAHTSGVTAVLHSFGLTPIESDYQARVRLLLEMPERQRDEVLTSLKDACGGQLTVEDPKRGS